MYSISFVTNKQEGFGKKTISIAIFMENFYFISIIIISITIWRSLCIYFNSLPVLMERLREDLDKIRISWFIFRWLDLDISLQRKHTTSSISLISEWHQFHKWILQKSKNLQFHKLRSSPWLGTNILWLYL